jgi:hypothetical protein
VYPVIPKPFEDALLGQPVSHVWRGHGSALFLEFGTLTPSSRMRRDGSTAGPTGEITLMIEWSWRVERPRSILCGSWSNERRWPSTFQKMIGAKVVGVRTFAALPEIEVALSNGLRVVSLMTAEGQPEWALISRKGDIGSLCVRRGKLHVESISLKPSARGMKRPG